MLLFPSPKTITAFIIALLAAFAIVGCQNNETIAPIANAIVSPAGDDKAGGSEWVGRTVTPFSLPDADGKTVNLADALGKKPVVLIFYRGNWCPFCHAQMQEIADAKAKLTASGAAVYALSSEDAKAIKAMRDAHKLDWVTFLADAKGDAARQFGGTYPGQATLKPVTLVVGKDSTVVYAYTNEDYKQRATTQAVLDAVSKAK